MIVRIVDAMITGAVIMACMNPPGWVRQSARNFRRGMEEIERGERPGLWD